MSSTLNGVILKPLTELFTEGTCLHRLTRELATPGPSPNESTSVVKFTARELEGRHLGVNLVNYDFGELNEDLRGVIVTTTHPSDLF